MLTCGEKIKDLRPHIAWTGQTHSRAARPVSYWAIWYPRINPGVGKVLFCHDQCYKVTHNRREWAGPANERLINSKWIDQSEASSVSLSHMTSGGCHDMAMWWEIHDMHSWHNSHGFWFVNGQRSRPLIGRSHPGDKSGDCDSDTVSPDPGRWHSFMPRTQARDTSVISLFTPLLQHESDCINCPENQSPHILCNSSIDSKTMNLEI